MLRITDTREDAKDNTKNRETFEQVICQLGKLLEDEEVQDKWSELVKSNVKKVDLVYLCDAIEVIVQNFKIHIVGMVRRMENPRVVYNVKVSSTESFTVVARGVLEAIEIVASLRGSDEELEEVTLADTGIVIDN